MWGERGCCPCPVRVPKDILQIVNNRTYSGELTMPTYDYHCDANSRTISVQHSMKEKISTWGELCERAGVEPGKTAATSPVERIISGGIALPIASAAPALPMSGGCCGAPSGCGHHH